MIIDTFLFGWELEMLECRLMEMNEFVDWFVLVESEYTFQGNLKPLTFNINKHRYKQYLDKIIYVIAEPPHTDNPWHREYASRERIKQTLELFSDDDIIIHGDVDEIMPKSIGVMLEELVGTEGPIVLEQDFYSMAVDWAYPTTWQGTVAARNSVARSMSMTDLRNARVYAPSVRGGWHFSWLGGPEMIEHKAASFSHTEDSVQSYVREMGPRLYKEGYHVLGEKLTPVEVGENYPAYIKTGLCPTEWFRPRQ